MTRRKKVFLKTLKLHLLIEIFYSQKILGLLSESSLTIEKHGRIKIFKL